jgi:hypothetical protein
VLAFALAEGLITIDDIPPKLAADVNERLVKEEPMRVRNTAADKGTEVHDLVERIDNGEAVDVPPELTGHVESWRQCKHHYGFRTELTEFSVFSPTHDYAGTGDWLGYSDLFPEWGLILADYKTSESGIWPDIALQLAALKYADFIGVADEGENGKVYKERPIPKIKTCLGIQVTGEGYKVVPVNVSQGTFKVFLSAINVARWKTQFEQFALEDAEFILRHDLAERAL